MDANPRNKREEAEWTKGGHKSCPRRPSLQHRLGVLALNTIKELMLFTCTTKSDVDSEQLALVDKYLSTQEKQTKKKQRGAQKKQEELDPISDGASPSTTEATARFRLDLVIQLFILTNIIILSTYNPGFLR
ncbi:hypothetical protein BBP40_008909 [Aspergillus hancockii]|nr:hypothetical protein BBP40_008909 [Aspergillus hancockii]